MSRKELEHTLKLIFTEMHRTGKYENHILLTRMQVALFKMGDDKSQFSTIFQIS